MLVKGVNLQQIPGKKKDRQIATGGLIEKEKICAKYSGCTYFLEAEKATINSPQILEVG